MKATHSIQSRNPLSSSIKSNAEVYKTAAIISFLLVFGVLIAIKSAAAYTQYENPRNIETGGDQNISLQAYWWENRSEITDAGQPYWWENKAEQAELKTREISYWWVNSTGAENARQPYWWENRREQVNLKTIALI